MILDGRMSSKVGNVLVRDSMKSIFNLMKYFINLLPVHHYGPEEWGVHFLVSQGDAFSVRVEHSTHE
jgi:hypothetical protein